MFATFQHGGSIGSAASQLPAYKAGAPTAAAGGGDRGANWCSSTGSSSSGGGPGGSAAAAPASNPLPAWDAGWNGGADTFGSMCVGALAQALQQQMSSASSRREAGIPASALELAGRLEQHAFDRAQVLSQQVAEAQRVGHEKVERDLREQITGLKLEVQRQAAKKKNLQEDCAHLQQDLAVARRERALEQQDARQQAAAAGEAAAAQERRLREALKQLAQQREELDRRGEQQAAQAAQLQQERQQHEQTQLLLQAAEQQAASGQAQLQQLNHALQRAEQQVAEESARRGQAERDVEALRQQRISLQAQVSEVR